MRRVRIIKKVLFIICIIVVLIFIFFAFEWGQNWHNSIGNTNPDCQEWFEDTGINVKTFQNRLYHIVRDGNGYLYYMSDIENNLIPVVNELGLPTKDTAVFEP